MQESPPIHPFSMSYRPSTAQSAISSELSDDEDNSRTRAKLPSPLSQSSSPLSGTQLPGPTPLSTLLARNNARSGTSSRPDSPVSQISKSHVPSLAAQGFFRPMSSQRLQAQRLGRPGTAKTRPSISTEDETRDFETETRPSLSTVRRERQGAFSPVQEHEGAPPSRGTEFSEPILPDRAANAGPLGNGTTRSLGDSVRLLNERASSQRQKKPQHLNLPKSYKQGDSGDPPLKSPRSFRSGFSLGSKRESSRQQVEAGHQHLSSNATSPRFDATQNPTIVPETASLGKNYEYFEGNTVFFWGGRFQNARDRPVNIATGILIVLPGILFLAFSFVPPTLFQLVPANSEAGGHGYGIMFHQLFPLFSHTFSSFAYLRSCMPHSSILEYVANSDCVILADLPGLPTKSSSIPTTGSWR